MKMAAVDEVSIRTLGRSTQAWTLCGSSPGLPNRVAYASCQLLKMAVCGSFCGHLNAQLWLLPLEDGFAPLCHARLELCIFWPELCLMAPLGVALALLM